MEKDPASSLVRSSQLVLKMLIKMEKRTRSSPALRFRKIARLRDFAEELNQRRIII